MSARLFKLVRYQIEQGDGISALSALKCAETQEGTFDEKQYYTLHFLKGAALYHTGQYTAAIQELKIATSSDASQYETLEYLGKCALATGRLDVALKSLTKALAMARRKEPVRKVDILRLEQLLSGIEERQRRQIKYLPAEIIELIIVHACLRRDGRLHSEVRNTLALVCKDWHAIINESYALTSDLSLNIRRHIAKKTNPRDTVRSWYKGHPHRKIVSLTLIDPDMSPETPLWRSLGNRAEHHMFFDTLAMIIDADGDVPGGYPDYTPIQYNGRHSRDHLLQPLPPPLCNGLGTLQDLEHIRIKFVIEPNDVRHRLTATEARLIYIARYIDDVFKILSRTIPHQIKSIDIEFPDGVRIAAGERLKEEIVLWAHVLERFSSIESFRFKTSPSKPLLVKESELRDRTRRDFPAELVQWHLSEPPQVVPDEGDKLSFLERHLKHDRIHEIIFDCGFACEYIEAYENSRLPPHHFFYNSIELPKLDTFSVGRNSSVPRMIMPVCKAFFTPKLRKVVYAPQFDPDMENGQSYANYARNVTHRHDLYYCNSGRTPNYFFCNYDIPLASMLSSTKLLESLVIYRPGPLFLKQNNHMDFPQLRSAVINNAAISPFFLSSFFSRSPSLEFLSLKRLQLCPQLPEPGTSLPSSLSDNTPIPAGVCGITHDTEEYLSQYATMGSLVRTPSTFSKLLFLSITECTWVDNSFIRELSSTAINLCAFDFSSSLELRGGSTLLSLMDQCLANAATHCNSSQIPEMVSALRTLYPDIPSQYLFVLRHCPSLTTIFTDYLNKDKKKRAATLFTTLHKNQDVKQLSFTNY